MKGHRTLMICRSLTVPVATASLLALFACGQKQEPAAPEYAVRAEVIARGNDGLTLRHEAIPDFRDQSGEVVGMAAMQMRFDAGPTVSLAEVAQGDKVQVTFQVEWPKLLLTGVKILPADTELTF